MEIDIFTLFPEWFEWFGAQRHVRNALDRGFAPALCELSRALLPERRTGRRHPFWWRRRDGAARRCDGRRHASSLRHRRDRGAQESTGDRARPRGRLLDESYVQELAAEPAITLLCGRYEGFDERIVEHLASESLSIGRYVLSGGEPAAMVLCDSLLRKLPGALGHVDSAVEESFSEALEGEPEYPHYTRPAEYRGWRVPRSCSPVITRASASGVCGRVGHEEQRRGVRRLATVSRWFLAALQVCLNRVCARASSLDGLGRPARSSRYHRAPRAFATIRSASGSQLLPLTRRILFAMSTVIESIERKQLRRVPDFGPGDRVRVHFQVIEGTRRRIQVFEGVVIKRQGHGARETFTVRKQSFGVGVERMFPVHSPKIERIEVAARGDVRRAKLYYLRDRVGKRARVRERRYTGPEETVQPGLLYEPTEATDAEGATASETAARESGRRRRREPRGRHRGTGPSVDAQGAEQTTTSTEAQDEPSASLRRCPTRVRGLPRRAWPRLTRQLWPRTKPAPPPTPATLEPASLRREGRTHLGEAD